MPALIERNVDPAKIHTPGGRSVTDYRRDVQYLANHEEELTAKFPNEWVAIYNVEVVAHSRRAAEVSRSLRLKRIPRNAVVIQYLSKQPMTLIL